MGSLTQTIKAPRREPRGFLLYSRTMFEVTFSTSDLIWLVRMCAVGTFLVFMSLVFVPKLIRAETRINDVFLKKTSLCFAIFYSVLFWQLFAATQYITSDRLAVVGFVLAVFGLGFALWGRLVLRPVWQPITAATQQEQIITHGPFQFARHPIYEGRLCFYVGVLCLTNYWLLPIAVLYYVVLSICAHQEEQLLKRDQKYQAYLHSMASLPRLFWKIS